MKEATRKRSDPVLALLDSQRTVLERIASGAPLPEVLQTLVKLIERQAPDMRCAILLSDPEGKRLRFVAAPNIPEDYKAGVEPFLRIEPGMGSCGIAAYLREPVYTEDTATDPRWALCRDVAVRNGLRAIWSTPILADDNSVLGTFAMYYGQPRLPSSEHIQLIDMATQMVRVAVQSKQDAERLRASREKFRLIAENARDLISLTDPRGLRLYLSPSYQSLFENPAEWIGKSILDSLLPDDRAKFAGDFKNLIETGIGRRFDVRVRGKNGDIRFLQAEASPIRDATGGVTSVLSVGRDITEERRTQDLLREREELLRTIVENTPAGVAIADTEHRLLRVNSAFCRIVGYSESELEGNPVSFFTHEDDRAKNDAVFQQLYAGSGGPLGIEKRYRRKDGSIVWVLVTVVLVRSQAREPRYTVALIEDISERRRTDETLRRSAEDLQALSRRLVAVQEAERRELASELHDRIGQNLTGLSLNLGILKARLAESPDHDVKSRLQDSLALVESTAGAVAQVSSDLRPPMLDDHGLPTTLKWYARQFAKRSGIRISVEIELPQAAVSPEVQLALFRIAQEALNNVAKHAQATEVTIELRCPASDCVMTISDNGVGFDAAQIEGSRRARTGLGIVTMRERAQAIGGHFEVGSLPGEGTRVLVRVPR